VRPNQKQTSFLTHWAGSPRSRPHIINLEIEQVELLSKHVHVPRVGLLDQIEPFHTREANSQVAPYVVGAVVEVERLEITLGGFFIVAQVGVADAQVEPPACIPRLEFQRTTDYTI
jgi:hypothetical protein